MKRRNPLGDTWQITHAGQTNANPGRRRSARRGARRNPRGDYMVVEFTSPTSMEIKRVVSSHASERAAQAAHRKLVLRGFPETAGTLRPDYQKFAVVMSPAKLKREQARIAKIRGARRNPADSVSARELTLTTINDGELYRSQAQSIIENLAKKMAKGAYNREMALKLWLYLADNGARKYSWEFGTRKRGARSWHQQGVGDIFDKPTRMEAAREIAEHYDEELRERAAEIRAAQASKKSRAKRNPHAKATPNLRVVGTRWQDSAGNTYHKAYIYIGGSRVGVTPITYGYGYQFEETAKEWLKDHGYAVPKRISGEARDVRRKKDL